MRRIKEKHIRQENVTKVGNVKVRELKESNGISAEYSDGPIEDDLLDIMQSSDASDKRRKVLSNNPVWAMQYHLSPVRANLVNWYTFQPGSKILEVGAGCGAITESLLGIVDKDTSIDALELSKKRALINAYRNTSARNLHIIVGNVESLEKNIKYDYIICVGVLEYAGRFISGDRPFESFLSSLYDLLAPNGTLLLAIENKLGLKYMNGSREDHTTNYYDSLMSYPRYDGIRTFSKYELTELFRATQFHDVRFFFPLPDYKLPRLVLSERAIERLDIRSLLLKHYPAPAPDQTRVHIASEQLMLQAMLDARLFPEIANSFLVEAKRES